MDNRMWLGVVHVVEWLRPEDLRTGWELFGELEPLGIAAKPQVKVQFWRASSRADFIGLLRTFEEQFRADGLIPFLHIETHGSIDGIGLSNEDGIVWPELMEEFIPLNRLTRLNLIVMIAACEGFWGIKMLQPDRRAAAFRGLIAPYHPISAEQLATACLAFHRTVFSKMDGEAAFMAMNDAVGATTPTFWKVSAETAFKVVYSNYLKERCSPEEIKNRAAAVASNVAKRVAVERGFGLWKHEMERIRTVAHEYLGAHVERFEEMRREFFFIDLYPENDQRFDFTIEDCWPSPTATEP